MLSHRNINLDNIYNWKKTTKSNNEKHEKHYRYKYIHEK